MKYSICKFIAVLACINFSYFPLYSFSSENLEIIVIRHGQADHNVKSVRNANPLHVNYTISHLTEEGKLEVAATARRLQEEGFEKNTLVAIYVSPLPRVDETANIVMQGLGISEGKKVIDSRLIERQVGDFEGHPFAPILDYDIMPEGGIETQAEVKARVASFYDFLLRTYTVGTVMVVTHGSPAEMLGELISGEYLKVRTGQALKFLIPVSQGLCEEQQETALGGASSVVL